MKRFPAPPTGHDLMAMFPAQPPSVTPYAGGPSGPTSGWFGQQERAYFAKNVEQRRSKDSNSPSKAGDASLSPRSPQVIHLPPAIQTQKSSYMSPTSPHSSSPTILHLSSQYTAMSVSPPMDSRSAPSPSNSTSSSGSPSSSFGHDSQAEDWRDKPVESWRIPTNSNERRRAGKHTKRVIVRA